MTEDEKDFEEILLKMSQATDKVVIIYNERKFWFCEGRRTLREKMEWIESKKRELEEDPKEIFKKKYIGEFREQKEEKDG